MWRCDGDPFCNLKTTQGQSGFELLVTPADPLTATLSVRLPAAQLKKEAILCRASNKFDTKEEWLLFDDRVQIEQAELEATEGGEKGEGAGEMEDGEEKKGADGGKEKEDGSILDGDDLDGVDIANDKALTGNVDGSNKDSIGSSDGDVTEALRKTTEASKTESDSKTDGNQQENQVAQATVEPKKVNEEKEESDLFDFAASGDGEI